MSVQLILCVRRDEVNLTHSDSRDYMTQRWEVGCHNASRIWREIQKLGFDGSYRIVGEWATKRRKPMESPHSNPMPTRWTPRSDLWLFVKQEDELTEDEQQALERMNQTDEKVAEAYALGQRFIEMVRERQPESLQPWLEDVTRSGIDTLKRFAKGIR